MNRRIVEALAELGIVINDVQYKYPPSDTFGFLDDQPTKFILKGGFREEGEMQQLLEDIMIVRGIRSSKHPAVKDLYEKLKTTAGITNG